jgi:hypothetical protein
MYHKKSAGVYLQKKKPWSPNKSGVVVLYFPSIRRRRSDISTTAINTKNIIDRCSTNRAFHTACGSRLLQIQSTRVAHTQMSTTIHHGIRHGSETDSALTSSDRLTRCRQDRWSIARESTGNFLTYGSLHIGLHGKHHLQHSLHVV